MAEGEDTASVFQTRRTVSTDRSKASFPTDRGKSGHSRESDCLCEQWKGGEGGKGWDFFFFFNEKQ